MKFSFQKLEVLSERIRNSHSSAVDLTRECIKRIKDFDKDLNSFVLLNEEGALKQAGDIDALSKKDKQDKKLCGIPVAIKDNIITKDIRTTCCSKILNNFIPPYDATVVKRLKDAGAIIIGKTNMDEFAMGSSNEHSHFGPVKNPYDKKKVPGGSSGGSAASTSARLVPAALGSDTGGSVRQPASFCGICGLKPTYGRISRYGLIAFASSLDQIGLLTTSVSDCALLSEVLFGHDSMDSTSANTQVDEYSKLIQDKPKKLKLGIVREFLKDGIDPEVKHAFLNAIDDFKSGGFEINEVSLPHSDYSIATYYIIANAEASANLARYDGVRYGFRNEESMNIKDMYLRTRGQGFGKEVKRRIMLGTFVLSSGYYDAYYGKAQKVRTLIRNDFDNAFKNVDLILSPTSPGPAFGFNEKLNDPIQMYLTDVYTTSINLAGLPALSIPCGFTKEKLPVGLQIIGKPFREDLIFSLANMYEQKRSFTERHPNL